MIRWVFSKGKEGLRWRFFVDEALSICEKETLALVRRDGDIYAYWLLCAFSDRLGEMKLMRGYHLHGE